MIYVFFLLLSVFVIYFTDAKDPLRKYIGIFGVVVFGIIVILVRGGSRNDFYGGYQIGSAIAECIVPILVSILIVYYCLNKKAQSPEGTYKIPRTLFVAIAGCAIIAGIQKYTEYQREKDLQRIINILSDNGDEEIDSIDNNNDIEAEMFRKILLREVKAANTDSSHNENGVTLVKCDLIDKSLVYVVQFDYLTELSEDDVNELKNGVMEYFKEDANMMYMIKRMGVFGYDFVYKYIDAEENVLAEFTIYPYMFD